LITDPERSIGLTPLAVFGALIRYPSRGTKTMDLLTER